MVPVVDVMLGGERCFFLPNTTSGWWCKDTKDVVANGHKNGYNVFSGGTVFDALKNASNARAFYYDRGC